MRMRTIHVEGRRGRMYGTFLYGLEFSEAANRSYINILNVNSLWSTDSRRIGFGCLSNVRHTVECCLPRLGNTSTLNDRLVFACHVHVLFVFRRKPGLTHILLGLSRSLDNREANFLVQILQRFGYSRVQCIHFINIYYFRDKVWD